MNRCQQTIGHIVQVSQSCAIYAEHKTIAFSRRSSAVQVGFCSVLYQSRAALPRYQAELKKKVYASIGNLWLVARIRKFCCSLV